jgi:hypothetical protein
MTYLQGYRPYIPLLAEAKFHFIMRVFKTTNFVSRSIHKNTIKTSITQGRAVAQRLDAGFPPRRPGFAYGQHVGFVVDKAALGQVFPEYFGFPCQSFHRLLHYRNHPGLTQ